MANGILFKNNGVIKMTDELEKMLEEYDKHFSSFPTIPLLRTYSAEENIKIIKRCLAENKDVYELGYLPDPSLPENIDTYFD